MIQMSDLPMLLLLPALLVASGFFSGSETSLFSLSAHQRRRLARAPDLFSHAASTLLQDTRGLLITLLLGNMTVNVVYFVISTMLILRLETRGDVAAIGVSIASVGTLVALILTGEIFPKMVAARLPSLWTRTIALPMLAAHRALWPLRLLLNAGVITPLARLIAPRDRPPELSPEELETLLKLSGEQGVIAPEEERELQQVLALSQIKVRQIMTPRVAIEGLDLTRPVEATVEAVRAGRFSRHPVYRQSLDAIEGVLLARQLLLHEPADRPALEALVRPVSFVPEQQRVDQLLVQFRKSGTTFAVVVDEYGGTAGLLTLEDIVEEMVGQITDDTEGEAAPRIERLGESDFRVRADLPIRDWWPGPRSPEQVARTTEVSTFGGLFMARLQRLPRPGESIQVGNLRLEVETMDGARIQWVRVHLVPPGTREEARP